MEADEEIPPPPPVPAPQPPGQVWMRRLLWLLPPAFCPVSVVALLETVMKTSQWLVPACVVTNLAFILGTAWFYSLLWKEKQATPLEKALFDSDPFLSFAVLQVIIVPATLFAIFMAFLINGAFS